jgi:RNA-directed DNA polymerase
VIIERMARELGLAEVFVQKLARSASHEYKEYLIPKRTGGSRIIHHPSKRLKALQRWLLFNVVESLPVHEAATAYRRNKSILDNARPHAASCYLLRMDFTNFFPSITQKDLKDYIGDRPDLFSNWNSADVEVFCQLVCRNSVLTIGSPTSPGLSNALCYEMDAKLQSLCAKSRVIYTRYADDRAPRAQRAEEGPMCVTA